jgi:hypothetical protein
MLAAECLEDGEELGVPIMNWSVNGAPGGNATVGTVDQGNPSAVYVAPAKPPGSPVAVSVEYTAPRGSTRQLLLVSNLLVQGGPAAYTGTFSLDRTSGGAGTGLSRLDFTGRATLSLTPWEGHGQNTYRVSGGAFVLQSAAVEQGPCLCTGSGGEGSLGDRESSLTWEPADTGAGGTYTFDLGTQLSFQASCTPQGSAKPSDCPPRAVPLTVQWSVRQVLSGGCDRAVTNSYTDLTSLVGSSNETCSVNSTVTKDEHVSWSFVAQQ